MKGNSKKLAVSLIMAAIVMFITVTTAPAFDRSHYRKYIIGEYGFTGSGNCISTPFANWDPHNPFVLIDLKKVSASSYHVHGILTFKKDGTGTIDLYSTGTPTGPSSFTLLYPWSATRAHTTYPFTYTITGDDEFIFEAVENTFKQETLDFVTGEVVATACRDNYKLKGWISADHKTIVVATPAPEIDTIFSDPTCSTPAFKVICHDSHTCTRLSD
jgi:hypothetical protein